MGMAETVLMTPIIRWSALILFCVYLQGTFLSWGQSSKDTAELTYSSFQGQPAPSKELITDLLRQVRWDTRAANQNPQGLRLRFEKIEDPASPAESLARYRVFADGAPENKVYTLGIWSVGKALSYSTQEIYANSQGLLMIHKPTPEQDTRFKVPGDELELMPQVSAAEPVRYILSSKDGQLSMLGTVVPRPVVARDQACTLEVRIAEPDAAAMLIVASGFPGRARIPVVLESEGETATLTMTTDAGGQAEVADLPEVLGKGQGTLKATAEGSDCLPSALLPWGASTMVQKTP
jgi:hypothetical protein